LHENKTTNVGLAVVKKTDRTAYDVRYIAEPGHRLITEQ